VDTEGIGSPDELRSYFLYRILHPLKFGSHNYNNHILYNFMTNLEVGKVIGRYRNF